MTEPTAYIHPDAKIGNNVTIEPFAVIKANVEIGDGSYIHSHAYLMEGARLGKNVKVFPGAVISGVPQDLKFEGEETTVEIGDNTTIREAVTISRGTKDKYKTVIGKNCLVMAYSHIAHDCIIGNNCILVNGAQIAGHVEIGDWAIVGGNSVVHQFTRIGAHSFISGASKIGKDVPPYTKAGRDPLSYCGVNSVGLKRRGFTNEKINHVLDLYRVLYQSEYNTTQALHFLEENFKETNERNIVINFIKESKRGIMRGDKNLPKDDEVL